MSNVQKRKLGSAGLEVSPIGLGCMGMSEFYGRHSDAESLQTLKRATELGVHFWDTSDIYGPYTNELLLGRYFSQQLNDREKIVLASKFGIMRSDSGDFIGLNGRPEYVKQACDASLKRLGVETIDLYYQHRIDPKVPIEETVGAMSDLVTAGKVRFLGLSEAGADTLKRANAVHPISALQSEYSLWSRDLENSVIPTCEELGIGLVAYSPLGRGFLTGQIKSRDDFESDDWRLSNPRFDQHNFGKNLQVVERVHQLAQEKECTPAQLALAWVLAKGQHFVPIPGTRNAARLKENAESVQVQLSEQELHDIDELFPADLAQGTRYPEAMMQMLDA